MTMTACVSTHETYSAFRMDFRVLTGLVQSPRSKVPSRKPSQPEVFRSCDLGPWTFLHLAARLKLIRAADNRNLFVELVEFIQQRLAITDLVDAHAFTGGV